jgi:hypothetical protein
MIVNSSMHLVSQPQVAHSAIEQVEQGYQKTDGQSTMMES